MGYIAWSLCPPEVQRQVDELAKALPNDYNLHRPYHFVTASSWMDDMRSSPHREWGPWHYVDIPWTEDASGFSLPKPPHVIWALRNALEALRDPATDVAHRAQAVAMLIHCVGDLHQPLHACERDHDKGGNDYHIYGVPFTDAWPGSVPNLHTFWDKAYKFDSVNGAIVQTWKTPPMAERPSAPGEGIIATEGAKLMKLYPRESFQPGELSGTVEDWARESYRYACLEGYPPGEPPGDAAVRTIEPGFAHQAHERAQRRIVRAGYRVAALLTKELSPAPAGKVPLQ